MALALIYPTRVADQHRSGRRPILPLAPSRLRAFATPPILSVEPRHPISHPYMGMAAPHCGVYLGKEYASCNVLYPVRPQRRWALENAICLTSRALVRESGLEIMSCFIAYLDPPMPGLIR